MAQLSVGPWSYNRFNDFEASLQEGKKPDFLDLDKDGDKKESMKKASKDKEKDCGCKGEKDCDCDKPKKDKKDNMPPWLKGKKEVKEALMNKLMGEGLANNPVSAEIIAEHITDEFAEYLLAE